MIESLDSEIPNGTIITNDSTQRDSLIPSQNLRPDLAAIGSLSVSYNPGALDVFDF